MMALEGSLDDPLDYVQAIKQQLIDARPSARHDASE